MQAATKGLLAAILIIAAGLYLSSKVTTLGVWIVAIASVTLMIAIVGRFTTSRSMEIFITGFLLALPEAYVFLIQPNTPVLPELPGKIELFFGVAIVTRLLIFLLEIIPNPLQSGVKRLIG